MSFTTTPLDYSAVLRRAATHLAAGAADAIAELADAYGLDATGAGLALLVLLPDRDVKAALLDANPPPSGCDFEVRVAHHFALGEVWKRLRSDARAIRADLRTGRVVEAILN